MSNLLPILSESCPMRFLTIALLGYWGGSVLGATVEPGPLERVNTIDGQGGGRETDVAVLWGDSYPACWRPQTASAVWMRLLNPGAPAELTNVGSALKSPYTGPRTSANAIGSTGDPTVAANQELLLFHGACLITSFSSDFWVFQVDPAQGPGPQNALPLPGVVAADRTSIGAGTARGFGTDPQDPLYTDPGENLVYVTYGPRAEPGSYMSFSRAKNGGAQESDWLETPIRLTPTVDNSERPRLAVAPDGTLYVTFARPVPYRIAYAYSRTDGSQWSSVEDVVLLNEQGYRLDSKVDGAFEVHLTPVIAVDPRGDSHGLYLGYQDTEGSEPSDSSDVDVFVVPGEREPQTGEVSWGDQVNVSVTGQPSAMAYSGKGGSFPVVR